MESSGRSGDVVIAGYTTIDEIGRGGFGTVYRASDDAHGRHVAVKVLGRIDDDGAQRRFDRERRAMGTLSGHPNIAVVHTSGFTDDGRAYLVMEWLSGGSLADAQRARGALPVDEVVEIGVALADALAHAHDGGVLHLDLKPENVILSEFGRPKIVDFGIAALVDDEIGTTTIRATPSFADPTVLDGRPGTERSDVYGLAATLYALLVGEPPYAPTGGAISVLGRIASEPVPRIGRADVAPRLVDLLARAMDKDPDRRPASMADFRDELRVAADTPPPAPDSAPAPAAPAVAGIGGHANRTGPGPGRLRSLTRTNPTALGLALLGLAVVGLIGIVLLVSGRGDGTAGPSGSAVENSAPGGSAAGDAPSPSSVVTPASVADDAAARPIPDVSGRTEVVARTVLEALGVEVRRSPGCSALVESTEPPAGTRVEPGDTVRLVFPECRAPDFVGLRLPEAIDLVEEYQDLLIEWPDHCDDLVIGQEPAAGTAVGPGATITLELPSDC